MTRLIALLAWILLTGGASAGDVDGTLHVEISLTAIVEKPGEYDVMAVVREAEGGELIAAPFMRFDGGSTSVVSVTSDSGDRISLSIGPVFRGTEAQWLVVRRRDGETVARAAGRVKVF